MVVLLSILLVFSLVLLIIKSRKLKKLEDFMSVTENDYIVNTYREYCTFKSNSLLTDTISLKDLVHEFFINYDKIVNDYFYPRIGVEESDEENSE